MNKSKSNIILTLAIAVVVLFVVFVHLFINIKEEAFNHGYHKAIKDAHLIGTTEDTYYIQFGNFVYEYSFD